MSDSRRNRLISGFLILLTLWMSSLFVYFWDLYHTADYAMIGLMAKRLMEFGEQNIFVWRTGYMGTLLETNLVALVFSVFGRSPFTLNFVPFLFFLCLIPIFYVTVRRTESTAVAQLATFLLLLGGPFFYGKVIRTQPNYVEIFGIGLLLFCAYDRFERGRSDRWIALFGFLTGFGIYLYGQIFYFLGAIGAHLFLRYLVWFRKREGETWYKRLLFPCRRRSLVAASLLNGVHLLVAIVLWVKDIQVWSVFGVTVRSGPFEMIQTSAMVLIGLHLFRAMNVWWPWVRTNVRELLQVVVWFVVPFVVGISPKWIYDYWIQGPRDRMTSGVQVHFENVLRNLTFAKLALFEVLNLKEWTFLDGVCAVLYFAAGVVFVRVFLYRIRHQPLTRVSVFFLFPFTSLGIFLFAKFVFDVSSIRYLTVLFLAVAFMLAVVANELWKVRWKRPLVLIGLSFVLVNNGLAFQRKIQESDHGKDWKELVQILDAEKISYGFAHYWFAYTINFLTDERLIFEPVSSNFSPHYYAIVKRQDRVAYIETEPLSIQFEGEEIKIFGKKYTLEKEIRFRPQNMSIHQGPNVEAAVRKHGIRIFILSAF